MDLEGLQQLQEVDIQRDQAKRELQAVLDQISDPPFIGQLEAEIEAQAEEARQADHAVREAHAIVQTAQRRIEVTDNRLYSGSITDHRTLEELQRDLYAQRQQLPPLTEAETRASNDAELAHEAGAWLQQLRTKRARRLERSTVGARGRARAMPRNASTSSPARSRSCATNSLATISPPTTSTAAAARESSRRSPAASAPNAG